MTTLSNLLIIGSTGRNTGKTEFACSIIKKHAVTHKIVGIKIVPVDKNERHCHRGEDGCGLCDSLKGKFKIIEEDTKDTSKDTSRMLKAGAEKVFLLLADRNFLKLGIQALLKKLPEEALVIIESNSVRKVIEPGLFVVIMKSMHDSIKDSCADVIEFADKIIGFDKMKWDFLPDRILIQDGAWVIEKSQV